MRHYPGRMTSPALQPQVTEGPPGSGAVAGGSRAAVEAGAYALRQGGNAVDAALAAFMASAISEPVLTSLGGGGFLMVRLPDGTATVLDFFADTPGLGDRPRRPSGFEPVEVRYPNTVQVFHVGAGSVAVPGAIPGIIAAHEQFGSLPLATIAAPAIELAEVGIPIEPMQHSILRLVARIFEMTPTGRELVHRPDGSPTRAGDVIRMPRLADTLRMIADGTINSLASPALADPLLSFMAREGGLITEQDLQRYQVFHRAPTALHRHGSDILTNPAPSFGGSIIVDAMANTEQIDDSPESWAEAARHLGRATEYRRAADREAGVPHVTRGTTHVSVVDGDGMLAAMTTSNGSCAGVFVPGMGIHLNNMLGEEDLNPAGFHAFPPGLRMGSMMSPTVLRREDGTVMAMGTGGSERIRSALFAVLLRTVDLGMSAAQSIGAPRLHPERERYQLEPGWDGELAHLLAEELPVNTWDHPDIFFGGVHAVMRRPDGSVQAVGDPRRAGATAVVTPH